MIFRSKNNDKGLLRRFDSIRGRLLLLSLSMLVPILLVQAVIFHDMFETRRAEELKNNLEVARAVAGSFEQFIQNVLDQELAVGLALVRAEMTGLETPEAVNEFLRENDTALPAVRNFAWLNAQGQVIYSSLKEHIGRDLSDRVDYLAIQEGRDTLVSNLIVSRTTGEPIFVINRGFRDSRGDLLGIVFAAIDLDRLSSILGFERSGSGNIMLLDRTGRLVFHHPRRELSWDQRRMVDLSPGIETALTGKEIAGVEKDAFGEGISGFAFAPVSTIGWVAGASRPEAEMLAPIFKNLGKHLGLFLLVVTLSLPLAALVARTISSPIRRLRERSLRISESNQGFSELVGGPSEVRDLNMDLHRMIVDLNRAREEIESRAAEAEEGRNILDAIMENIPEGLLITAGPPDFRLKRCSRYGLEMTGRAPEELLGIETGPHASAWRFHLPDGKTPEREDLPLYRAAMHGEIVENMELVMERADGRRIPLLLTAAPVRDRHGTTVAAISAWRDITARKEGETALRESEELLNKVLEILPVGVWILDEHGMIVRANKTGRHIWSGARYVGPEQYGEYKGWWYETGKPIAPEEWAGARAFSRGETSLNEIIEIECFNGVHKIITHSALPLIEDGRIAGVIVVNEDVTDRIKAEAQVREAKDKAELLAAELEDRVLERTMELERASKTKDEFLANMSHEIRTPLTEVFGMTDVLLQQPLPDPIRKDLETIRGSFSTILTMLNDILDLTRIEHGQLKLNPHPFEFREMVTTLVRPYILRAAEKMIAFELTMDEELPMEVVCDPDRIGQVLKNLLSNAVKFSEQGTIRVFVQVEERTEHTAGLRFSVSDTGIGIPQGKQGLLFQPFTQLDPSSSKRFAGTGLGLAISKRLVELMDGEITFRSTPGKGSTFSFTVGCELKASEDRSEEPQPLSLTDLPALSILLAEDNPVNRLFLRRVLTNAAHEVIEAENGLEVLEKFSHGRFDLILMDIQMPELDGVETMLRIRSGEFGRPDIPIIALTAYAMKGDRERFMTAGMDGYVTKPVDFKELAQAIADTGAWSGSGSQQ